jgi:hypothetical protein
MTFPDLQTPCTAPAAVMTLPYLTVGDARGPSNPIAKSMQVREQDHVLGSNSSTPAWFWLSLVGAVTFGFLTGAKKL